MTIHLFFLLSILMTFGVSGGHVHDVDDIQDVQQQPPTQPLDARVDRLERLVLMQSEKLSHQEILLQQYHFKLETQETVLRQQGEKLSQQETLLRHYIDKLSVQDKVLQQQDSRVATLEREVSRKASVLSQETRTILHQQAQLPQYHSLLRLQAPKLSDQENQKKVKTEGKALAQSPTMTQASPFESQDHKKSVITDNVTNSSSLGDQLLHNVNRRSDDSGPLEVVVNQLSQHVTELTADVQTLKTSSSQHEHDIQDARTSTFIHWGSSACADASNTVYSGIVGGSLFSDTGAAANFLCLTSSPIFLQHQPAFGTSARLFGGEYHSGFPNTPDAVCSVCRSTFSTTLMIPGTNVCTPGWHLQYSGYLMAGRYDHAAGSEYICVDSKLDTYPHSEAAQNGALLYYTITHCGSLPCPSPYTDSKVVTCAVCSK